MAASETWKKQRIQLYKDEAEINKQKTGREVQFVSAYLLDSYFFTIENELITISVFSL